MGKVGAWLSPSIFIDGYRISGEMTEAQLSYDHAVLDVSHFNDLARVRIAGLRNIALTGRGWANLAQYEQDEELAGNVGLTNTPVSIFPSNTPVAGDPALFFEAATTQYSLGGQVGEILGFNFSCAQGGSAYPLARGAVLEPGTVAKTATGTGTALNLGAVLANQYVYAVLHVLGVSAGDAIDVTIESDDAQGFASPTTRATFAQKTAIGGAYLVRVAGPVADTWWRVKHTLTGASISILYACAMAIQGA
jgi:hypothetical protein